MKAITFFSLLQFAVVMGYFFIAAQGAFYHLAFGKALKNIPADSFMELRRAIDPAIRVPLKSVYLSTLALMTLTVVTGFIQTGFSTNIWNLLALLMLIADIILVIKVSEPINHAINSLADISHEQGKALQAQWIKAILFRGYLSIAGFILLLVPHLLFKNH